MQKTKRVILFCLLKEGPLTHFKIRDFFKKYTSPTNSAALLRHLDVLERSGCVSNLTGYYSITKKGEELLDTLNHVIELLK